MKDLGVGQECHVMDLGWVRRVSCERFGGVSGGCHVMD